MIISTKKNHTKIKFVDFWPGFNPEDFFIFKILSNKYELEISDKPDFVFCSVFGHDHLKYNDCVKIFWTGENQSPDFNFYDYAIGFDYIDFGERYIRVPLYMAYTNIWNIISRRKPIENLKDKTDFCSFIVSNRDCAPERIAIFNKLSLYRKVSSGGRYLNNIGGPVDNKIEFQRKHKFAIAFENTSYPGYVTEKILEAFASQTIPIYWGDPTITEVFNEAAFINCNAFKSLDDVVNYVIDIDNDDNKFIKMVNANIFKDESYVSTHFENLQAFLYRIFDSSPDDAKKFSRQFWCRRYSDQAILRDKIYRRSLKNIIHRINLFVKKICRK